ncbi:fused MFS/spermidine synthase [Nitrospira japonica]
MASRADSQVNGEDAVAVRRSAQHAIPMTALLLAASGAAALVYQVLWIKQLSLIVGVDVYAVAAGISAFFGGMALGSLLLGRVVDRVRRPLLFYGGIEAGIAALSVSVTVALPHTAELFATAEAAVGPAAWTIPLALVAVPAVLMGGTLSALLRSLQPLQEAISFVAAGLYASNTLGAVAGALLCSFLLIPFLGIRGAALAAAAANLAVVAGAIALDRMSRPFDVDDRFPPAAVVPGNIPLALVLYSIAGGIALGYEVVWSQAIVPFMSTRSFAFSIVLATYLAGLVIGSALCARHADRLRHPWAAFGFLLAAAGAVALLEIALLGRWLVIVQTQAEAAVLALTSSPLFGMCTRFAVAAVSIVFVPTLLLGAAFPVVIRLTVDARHVGRQTGAVVALNTAGGIAGTLVTGFVLVPMLGLVHALAALAIAASVVGGIAAMREAESGSMLRWATLGTGVLTVLVAVVTPADRLASLLPGARAGTLLFYDESPGGTVAVVENRAGHNRFRRLYIEGVSNSGDAMPSMRYMRLQALLPLVIHNGEPRSALVIGFGTGITAGALLAYEDLERRVVAELLPAVVRTAPLFPANLGAGDNPKIDVRLRDGRRELLRSQDEYDVITLEPPPPSAAGVVNLYSTEFYALVGKRLKPSGLLAQWLPLSTQNDEDTRSLVRSVLDSFPHVSLWTTEFNEMLLVGSFEPLQLDVPRITERLSQPGVATALRQVGIASPAALLALWVTDRAGLERYAAGAPAVTDDRPRIEYASWVRPKEVAQTLPGLLALYEVPPLRGDDEMLRSRMTADRERLMTFYRAGLHAYDGDRPSWREEMRRVMNGDPDPYYGWFIHEES